MAKDIIKIKGNARSLTIDMDAKVVSFQGKNWPLFPGKKKNLPAFLVEYVRIVRKRSTMPSGKRKLVYEMTKAWLGRLGLNTIDFEETIRNNKPQPAGD